MTEDRRQQKAQEFYEQGVRPVEIGRDVWTVQGSGAEPYEIRHDDGYFSCSCPDFAIRGFQCKHILLVRLSQTVESDDQSKSKCDHCIEARHYGPAAFSCGAHVWCEHSKALVEPEKKKDCEWFLDRAQLVIV